MNGLPAGIEPAAPRHLRLQLLLLPTLPVRRKLVERVGAREPLRRQPSGISAIAAPISKLLEREREGAAGGVGPREPLLRPEGLEIAQPAILVTLQPHAAPARHLWNLVEREDHHLSVLADRRDEFALHHRHRTRRVGRRDVERLFALARIGEAFVLGNDEAAALRACKEELTPALVAENSHDIGLLLEIDEKTDRLAMTAATRKLRRIESIESPVAGEHQAPRRGLGRKREFRPVVCLERDARQIADRAPQRTDPALLRHDHGDRFALDECFLDRRLIVFRCFRERGAALAQRRLGRKLRAYRLDLLGDLFPLFLFGADELLERLALGAQLLVLPFDLDFLELAQIAQP